LCSLHDGAHRDERASALRQSYFLELLMTGTHTRQARLSCSLRTQLWQREKLPNPPIYDFATTRQQSLANNFVF
jgi:hypothetical protein